ncbi:DEKNAAC105141 [Brettanomyces naardenensis]|uniref:DEKNAAC105141 n=1 Tax=Brettanomyces naardenensis TaxID=13370 RepID=A0A448YSZ9_BRENA|nr:DEKNAAC105141 [Brettanomyces naardenensis]
MLLSLFFLLIPLIIATVPTVSIIDVLSSNQNFSTFILSLQRNGLIDEVNELENVTFLAPVNSAFDVDGFDDSLLQSSLPPLNSSTIRRFIVDTPVLSKNVHGVNIYSTINSAASPYLKGLHVPILFDNEPDGFSIEDSAVVLPDLVAAASNSVVQGLGSLLTNKKPSLCDYLANWDHGSVGVPDTTTTFGLFAHLFSEDSMCSNLHLSNVTLLLPSDDSVRQNFSQIELSYLFNDRALTDRQQLLGNFVLHGMIGGNIDNTTLIAENLLGDSVRMSSRLQGNEITLENDFSRSASSNFLVADAVLHYFTGFVLPQPKLPIFTPRKYLIGLNQTAFVDEVDFRKLGKLIDDQFVVQTIFVDAAANSLDVNSNRVNSLLYEFVDGHVELDSDVLVDTKLCSQGSLGHCQKMKVSVLSGGSVLINDHAEVIPTRYQIGNTYIYLVDGDIPTPPRLDRALGPMDRCARSLQFMDRFGFLKFGGNGGLGYTIFLPTSDAWNQLDLTLDYLLANEDKLELVMGNLLLNGLIYGDFAGSRIIQNFNGDKLLLERRQGTKHLTVNNHVEIPFSFASQILFKEGVAYPVDHVVLPETMSITMDQLIETAEADEFISILKLVHLDHLAYDDSYSFIVPSSATLRMANITSITRGLQFLEEFARLHILPNDSISKALNCEKEIPTLLNGTHLTCRRIPSGGLMLQILEGSDHDVRILRKGFTTSPGHSGILIIDKPINPDWLDSHINPPIHLHLPLVSVLIGIVLGMVILAAIISCCFALTVGGKDQLVQDAENVDETSHLVAPAGNDDYGSIARSPATPTSEPVFYERYSTHAQSKAVDCPRVWEESET